MSLCLIQVKATFFPVQYFRSLPAFFCISKIMILKISSVFSNRYFVISYYAILIRWIFYLQCVSAFSKFDDSVLFRINWPGASEVAAPDDLLQRYEKQVLKPDEAIVVSTVDEERYLCSLPPTESSPKKRNIEYVGATPRELIRQLHVKNRCTYRIEAYWTYELCHGKSLVQYHEEKDHTQPRRATRQEYYLGQYIPELIADEERTFDDTNPPKRKIEDVVLPYYPVRYLQGSICDITDQPRSTTILYVCDPESKNQIHSIVEVSSCEYEVVVFTPHLCSHPNFLPEETKERQIECYPVDGAPPQPTSLTVWTREQEWENRQQNKQLILPRIPIDEKARQKAAARNDDDYGSETDDNRYQPPPITPTSDEALIRSFLEGIYCLYGGAGWWKHEYCHGRQVIQYHEDAETGSRTEILLGVWDEETHRQWISDKPHKKPLRVSDKIRQVTHFYGNGAICELSGKPRTVEVRLRCKDSPQNPDSVTLYLLELKTCEYTLGVESQIFCDIMQSVNEAGLFKNT